MARRPGSRDQRQPHSRRARVRVPRGVPHQHGGTAARQVPERGADRWNPSRARCDQIAKLLWGTKYRES